MTFQDEPPGSPRRSPPLAALIASEIFEAEDAARARAFAEVLEECREKQLRVLRVWSELMPERAKHGSCVVEELIIDLQALAKEAPRG